MQTSSKIYIAGHTGLVGSAIVRELKRLGFKNLLTVEQYKLDLCNQADVFNFFAVNKPDYVFLAAARVGGIWANKTQKADFIYDNLMISTNVISAAKKFGVKKLLNLGSSCIYPKLAPQPLKEEYLLTGPLEETNDAYAIAKITAIKLCRHFNEQYNTNFISVMPTNLYGPNDNFNLETAHVLPALIRKFHLAKLLNQKTVTLWGSGNVFREFLYVDDLAQAVIFLMQSYDYKDIGEIINIGVGNDLTIRELAKLIKHVVGFAGNINFDHTKPDGTPRKLLDISRITKLGWKPQIDLETGIRTVYEWYKNGKPTCENSKIIST